MSDSRPSRREFLSVRPQRSEDTEVSADDVSDDAVDERELARRIREMMYVEHYSKRAMACEFEFVFNLGQFQHASEMSMLAFDEIERLEDQMTVYRDWSELSRLNQAASQDWVAVEPRLFQLLLTSRELWKFTDGAFDITSTPLSRIWGFTKREGRFPDEDELQEARSRVGMQYVEFDERESRIRFTQPGLELNLGGIGKGYALDRCADMLLEQGLAHFMIHGGQSSIVGRGRRSGIERLQRQGWTIGLAHPVWTEQRLVEFQLRDRALGTSGTSRQSFYHRGKKYGHILDPRSGLPADRVLQATVLAPSAAEADALATAFYVLGVERARELCAQRDDLAVLLVTAGARRGSVDLHAIGLEDEDWRRVDGTT